MGDLGNAQTDFEMATTLTPDNAEYQERYNEVQRLIATQQQSTNEEKEEEKQPSVVTPQSLFSSNSSSSSRASQTLPNGPKRLALRSLA